MTGTIDDKCSPFSLITTLVATSYVTMNLTAGTLPTYTALSLGRPQQEMREIWKEAPLVMQYSLLPGQKIAYVIDDLVNRGKQKP